MEAFVFVTKMPFPTSYKEQGFMTYGAYWDFVAHLNSLYTLRHSD